MAEILTIEADFNRFLLLLGIAILAIIVLRSVLRGKLRFTFIISFLIMSFFTILSIRIVNSMEPETTNSYLQSFLLVNFAFAFLLTLYFQRTIINPLKILDKKTKKIADGDLVTFEDYKAKGIGETNSLAYSTNDLGKRFRGMISNIKNSAQELTVATESMAAGSELVSSTTNEISSTISSIAENASLQVRSLDEVSRVLAEMVSIIDSSMREIGVTSKITLDLAEQTNLVALNASIEAVKAGDAGEGFNVVADHVRQLSIESKSASHTVSQIIKGVNTRISDSVERIVEAVDKVAAVAENTAASSEEAAAATQEQSASLQEINEQARKLAILTTKTERNISEFVIDR